MSYTAFIARNQSLDSQSPMIEQNKTAIKKKISEMIPNNIPLYP